MNHDRLTMIASIVVDADEQCKVCRYSDGCIGIHGGPNGPIFPPCADKEDWIDEQKLEAYCSMKRMKQ